MIRALIRHVIAVPVALLVLILFVLALAIEATIQVYDGRKDKSARS
jgi:quinol-cytochrome oxidoreductase complex cytochrome b subunit